MKNYLTPLRSSMSLMTNMVKDKHPWGLTDILREKKRKEKRALIVDEFRAAGQRVGIRFAVARKSGSGFHIVGVGKIKARDFKDLKSIAKEHGFTHLRFGAIKTKLV